jgi:2-C-methyl-D-erythritol 4-phosphate cytidylyltransferase
VPQAAVAATGPAGTILAGLLADASPGILSPGGAAGPGLKPSMPVPPPRPRLYALVPCAGSGSRSGSPLPKQYVELAGAPLVAHTLRALEAVPRLEATLVVLAPDDDRFEHLVPEPAGSRRWITRCGGATRAATVAAGLADLRRHGAVDQDWVLVHDAARCLLRPAWADRLIDACIDDEVGGLLALRVADTLKAEEGGRVAATIDRRGKWAAQTPQMFRLGLLQRALQRSGDAVTDEAGAIEALGLRPRLVPGALDNLKVTWPEDFELAARLLASAPRATGTEGGLR